MPRGVRRKCCWKAMPEKNMAWLENLTYTLVQFVLRRGTGEFELQGVILVYYSCSSLEVLGRGNGFLHVLEWCTPTFPGRPRVSRKDGKHRWILEGRLWDAIVRWNSSSCVIQLMKRMAQNQLILGSVSSWTTCASSLPLRSCLVELGSLFLPCFPS